MSLLTHSKVRQFIADPDIAIDLGTANTRLYARGRGLIADEPSVVELRPDTGEVGAVDGYDLQSRSLKPRPSLISPLRAGVVADVNAAAALLTPLFKRARRFGMVRPRVLACTPTDACVSERQALVEATYKAGAAAVVLAPEPLAAAIGLGMDVSSPYAQMLVDIGDGVTDIAIVRSGSLVKTSAMRVACSDLIGTMRLMVREEHNVDLHPHEALNVIRKVGARPHGSSSEEYFPAGTDCRTGLLRRVRVTRTEVFQSIAPVFLEIIGFVGKVVRDLPPDLSCEIIESGIHLTGGGVCIPGVAERIAVETRLTVTPAKDPLHAVIKGARQMLAVGASTNIWETANGDSFMMSFA